MVRTTIILDHLIVPYSHKRKICISSCAIYIYNWHVFTLAKVLNMVECVHINNHLICISICNLFLLTKTKKRRGKFLMPNYCSKW